MQPNRVMEVENVDPPNRRIDTVSVKTKSFFPYSTALCGIIGFLFFFSLQADDSDEVERPVGVCVCGEASGCEAVPVRPHTIDEVSV
jgi:hypothetical protein